jgi:CRISPR-associated protein Csm5
MSLDHYDKLAITPLSPVHLGTGSDYEPTGYVIDEGALYEFDGLGALRVLPDSRRRELDRILSGKATPEMLRAVQAFFHQNRECLIAVSRKQVRVNPSVEAFYTERVGKVTQHETGGRKVQNRLEIERTAWNPTSGAPILPGSGLKGAIRTALLDRVNKGGRLDHPGETNRELQNRLFQFKAGKFELDPMRLVRLADASPAEEQHSATQVFFAVNRKKQPVEKNGTLLQSQAEQKGLYQLLECLSPMRPRGFAGTLVIQEVGATERPDKTPRLRFSLDDIAHACNAFYGPILERELELLRNRAFVDERWAKSLETMLASVAPRLSQGRAFLLRVGRHSGAESVTLNGLPRSIKIMKGKGEKPDYLDHAKTVWLAGHERQAQRGLLPFGWLLVEACAEDETLPDWPGVQPKDEQQEWREAVDRRVVEARRAIEEDLERERERVRQERRAEEEAQREREEKERALKAATENLPEDAAWVEERRLSGEWLDQNRFMADLETFLSGTAILTEEAYRRISTEVAARWKGILENPDAVQGKKKKPKYNPRPRALAKRLLELGPKPFG